jgi:hypothetical protein
MRSAAYACVSSCLADIWKSTWVMPSCLASAIKLKPVPLSDADKRLLIQNSQRNNAAAQQSEMHGHPLLEGVSDFRYWHCVTSIAGPHGDTQLYER